VNAQHGHEKLPAYGSVVSGRNENNPSTGGSYGRQAIVSCGWVP
jgi:hypothetical protein